jgi:hypothetical protein
VVAVLRIPLSVVMGVCSARQGSPTDPADFAGRAGRRVPSPSSSL